MEDRLVVVLQIDQPKLLESNCQAGDRNLGTYPPIGTTPANWSQRVVRPPPASVTNRPREIRRNKLQLAATLDFFDLERNVRLGKYDQRHDTAGRAFAANHHYSSSFGRNLKVESAAVP